MGLAMAWLLAGLVWSTPARADDPASQPSGRSFSLLSPQELSVRFSYGIGDRDSLRFYSLGARAAYAKQAIRDKLLEHKQYITVHGEDLPEVRNWQWRGLDH